VASFLTQGPLLIRLKERISERGEAVAHRFADWARERIGPISHVATEQPVAALTFDDGPDPRFTPRLLEVLDKHGAHATFFMLGAMASRRPDLVRQVAEKGHAIGNHTFDHTSVPLISRSERWRQIKACARALAPYEARLFRPPYGQRDLGSCLDSAILGYTVISWNAHAFDWLDHNAEWMAKHMIAQIRPGSIVTLHDALYHVLDATYADRTPTISAVDLMLEQLGHKYQFVTIPELLRRGRKQRESCIGPSSGDFLNGLKPNDGPIYVYGGRAAQDR
jgi:peptidoglycan-N-acetylglucosamine deacetylase